MSDLFTHFSLNLKQIDALVMLIKPHLKELIIEKTELKEHKPYVMKVLKKIAGITILTNKTFDMATEVLQSIILQFAGSLKYLNTNADILSAKTIKKLNLERYYNRCEIEEGKYKTTFVL